MDPRDYDFLSITVQDCKSLFLKKWPFYRRLVIWTFALVLFLSMATAPTFRAEAKCKKAFDPSEIPARLKNVLSTLPKASSHLSAPSVMKSTSFLKEIIAETGMQCNIQDHGSIARFCIHAATHLKATLGMRIYQKEGFAFKDVHYQIRRPLSLYLYFHDASHFSVLDGKKKELASGVIGEKVNSQDFSFTLERAPEDLCYRHPYAATLLPWDAVVKKVYKQFHVKEDRADKDILHLSFTSARQALSADFLNLAMQRYVEVVKKESIQVLQEHLEYFENRKRDLEEGYATFLKDHELYLQQSLRSEGFMGLKQEVAAFEGPSEEFYTKLYEVELELSRLSSIKKQAKSLIPSGKKQIEEKIDIEELVDAKKKPTRQQLQQLVKEELRTDDLQLLEKISALYTAKKESVDTSRQRIAAYSTMKSLTDEKVLVKAKERLLQYLQLIERRAPLESVAIGDEDRQVFDDWVEVAAEQELASAAPGNLQGSSEEARKPLKAALKEALTLIEQKLAQTAARTLLSTSFDAVLEGLNPETAQKLYLDYNRELDAVQLNIRQLCYLQQQIFEPDVELSSLCNLLTDPVSQQMIQKAAQMALELRDDRSRSVKEHDRIRDSLLTQKAFISHHISQMIELQNMRAHLIEEKIVSLQRSSVSLLETEKTLLEERLSALRSRMSSSMPKKWRMENELMLKKELFLRMIEGIAHLEESKRVDQNIQTSAFRVLDAAFMPLYLSSYSPLFLSFMVSFLSLFFSYGTTLLRLISSGSLISEPIVKVMGLSFLGSLSKGADAELAELSAADLTSLRQASLFTAKLVDRGPSTLGVFGNNAPKVAEHIAELLFLRGLKVIVIDSSFSAYCPSGHGDGLLAYLKRQSHKPSVLKNACYDFIPSGGYSFDCIDLLGGKAFSSLIDDLKKDYDIVILASAFAVGSAGAQVLYPVCDGVIAITLFGQPTSSLDSIMHWRQEGRRPFGIFCTP